ncbi:hypothetical protein V3C99_014926 [Haemonchus contortus]
MESSQCAYPASAGLFDELSWMSMPPAAYYTYPVSANCQTGYPMSVQHPLSYPSMANCWYGYNTTGMQAGGKYKKKRNLFTKLQLNMLQRRFAEKEHIRQPERDNFAQMIGLTGEQVKIWFQNQRYKRKHRESGNRNAGVSSSSGTNTSISSLSSPSPRDSPDPENQKRNDQSEIGIRAVPMQSQNEVSGSGPNNTFQQTQNYSQLYWGSQMAYYPNPPPTFQAQSYTNIIDEKLSISSTSENDLDL